MKIKFIDSLITLVYFTLSETKNYALYIFTYYKVVMLFQFKMKPQVHYGEDDCPVLVVNEFPKDDELHFEIEMIDFFKAQARVSTFNSLS